MIPVVTVIGTSFSSLFSEVILIQAAVGSGGFGILFLEAIYAKQYNIVMAGTLVLVIISLMSNYLLDILYGYIDRRIRIAKQN